MMNGSPFSYIDTQSMGESPLNSFFSRYNQTQTGMMNKEAHKMQMSAQDQLMRQNEEILKTLPQTLQLQLQNLQNDALMKDIDAMYYKQFQDADLLNKQAATSLTQQQAKWFEPTAKANISSSMAQTNKINAELPFIQQKMAADIANTNAVSAFNSANAMKQMMLNSDPELLKALAIGGDYAELFGLQSMISKMGKQGTGIKSPDKFTEPFIPGDAESSTTSNHQNDLIELYNKKSKEMMMTDSEKKANASKLLKNEEAYDKRQQETLVVANASLNALKELRSFKTNYDKSWFTGKGSNDLANTYGTHESLATNAVENMVIDLIPLERPVGFEGGQFLYEGIKKTKPTMKMSSEAVQEYYDKTSAELARMTEQPDFLEAAVQNGFSVRQAEQAWVDYQKNFPASSKDNIYAFDKILDMKKVSPDLIKRMMRNKYGLIDEISENPKMENNDPLGILGIIKAGRGG